MKNPPLLFAALLLGACTVGPSYRAPPAVAGDAAQRGRFVRATDPALTTAPGLARWWETLNDPVLTALVDDALAHSPTIDLAQARIREARAQLGAQRAGQLPSVSASASYLHAQLPGLALGTTGESSGADAAASGGSSSTSTAFDFYNLGGTASWEPDLFGGTRRGVEQARANVGRRFADLADAQVSLSAQVAQAYVNLRDVQARAALNRQSTTLQRRALALVEQRFAAGTASALDVERLRTQLNQTDAQNVPLAARVDQYSNELAMLTGRTPGTLDGTLGPAAPVPLPPPSVPIGNPAALIAHRPDVRSAERALAASTAGIGVQEAKRYPSIRFMGILGLGGTAPGDVLDPSKFSALLAPQLSWSFLDFGRNRAAVRQARAQRDEAEAQYRQAVLKALADAETSLSRFGNTRAQLGQLVQAQASAGRAAVLNAQRVAAGTSTVVDQLDIERQHLATSIAVAQAQAQLTLGYVAVQKALGLGWRDAAPATPASGAHAAP